MSKSIGVEAAKLAGLQIDLLQKYRNGQLTLEHLEWYLGLKKSERDAYLGKKGISLQPQPEKFALLADLGIITVPDDFVHETCLGMFFQENGKKLFDWNKNITDANFSHPSRILKPGDKLHVRVHHQIVSGTTTSEERMAYLERQPGNVYVGAQGIPLIFPKRDLLPKGKWYASFDEAENLWEDSDGDHGVPSLGAYSDGDFLCGLGCLGGVWVGDGAFLGFSDCIE